MPVINSLVKSQGAGIPGQWNEDIAINDVVLVAGHEPAILTVDHIVSDNLTFPALQVVGLDTNGRIVAAVRGTIAAVGVLVAPLTAGGVGKGVAVYRAGCFNPDALIWDASYSTDAHKFAAFNGAPTPTNIVIRRPKTATVA